MQRLIWSHAAPTVEVQRSGPGTGAVYTEPGPTQGAKSAGKRRRGSSPRDPQVAPHAVRLPAPTHGAAEAGGAHVPHTRPRPVRSPRPGRGRHRQSIAHPAPWIRTRAPGGRRPVRAEPRDGPACPPGLLLRRFEFPGARAARSDPAAAGRGGPQCPKRRVRKELCSKCARDAAFQRRREREESKTLSSVVLMLITRRSDVISDRLFFLCTF